MRLRGSFQADWGDWDRWYGICGGWLDTTKRKRATFNYFRRMLSL